MLKSFADFVSSITDGSGHGLLHLSDEVRRVQYMVEQKQWNPTILTLRVSDWLFGMAKQAKEYSITNLINVHRMLQG